MLCQCGFNNQEEANFCAQCGRSLPNIIESRNGTNTRKTIWILVLGVVVASFICACLWLIPTGKKVERQIQSIGTVTVESKERLQEIYNTYQKLSEAEQAKVVSIDVLLDAMEECDRQNGIIDYAIAKIERLKIGSLSDTGALEYALKEYTQALPYDLENRMNPSKALLDAAEAQINLLWEEQEKYRKEADRAVSRIISQLFSGDHLQAVAAQTEYNVMIDGLYPSAIQKNYANNIMDAICDEAQIRFDKGEYYAAISGLEQSDVFAEHCDSQLAEQAAGLKSGFLEEMNSIRPKNGAIIDRTYSAGRNTFKATAGDMDTCVKLELANDPEEYVIFYIRANETAKINFKNGEYRIKYTTGPVWYGEELMFGPEASLILLNKTIVPNGYSNSQKVTWHEFTWTITTGYGDEYGYQNMTLEEF